MVERSVRVSTISTTTLNCAVWDPPKRQGASINGLRMRIIRASIKPSTTGGGDGIRGGRGGVPCWIRRHSWS